MLCVCSFITPVDNRTAVLVLQHPGELDEELGTVPILTRALRDITVKTALSCSNIKSALGRGGVNERWAVLYPGGAKEAASLKSGKREFTILSRSGRQEADQWDALHAINGLVALDGSWRQVKALWWRNPWLLKLPRLILYPRTASRYGRLRREPRRESLSTLEAVALSLRLIEQSPEIETLLLAPFHQLLKRYRLCRAG